MTKLGPHIILPTAPALEWARRAPVVKVLDRPGYLADAPPGSLRVFRHYFPEQSLSSDPDSVANAILSALGSYRHPKLVVECFNEIGKGGRAEYIRLLSGVVPRLRAAGLQVAVPSWATGDYEQADWDAFRAAGWCGAQYVALHAYWGSQGLTQWHALRYRTYWRPGDPPMLITECGRDRVEGGQGGWLRDGISAAQYVEELRRFDAEISRDSYVAGATPFTAGATSDWEMFSTDGISAQLSGVAAPPPVQEVSPVRLRLAVIPSNQANPAQGGSTEQQLMDRLAECVWRNAAGQTAVECRVFAGVAETDLAGLPRLRAQLGQAKAWLDAAPAGCLTVALNLHSDSAGALGAHVGGYWDGQAGDVSRRLARRLAWAIAPVFGTSAVLGEDYGARGYLFATLMQHRHCPVLVECGVHQIASHVAVLREQTERVAGALVEAVCAEFGLTYRAPAVPALNWQELGEFSRWQQARIAARQDPRLGAEFRSHLRALGADWSQPSRYGWPA